MAQPMAALQLTGTASSGMQTSATPSTLFASSAPSPDFGSFGVKDYVLMQRDRMAMDDESVIGGPFVNPANPLSSSRCNIHGHQPGMEVWINNYGQTKN